MFKAITLDIVLTAATLAIVMAVGLNTALVKQAFAVGGGCSSCALSFIPNAFSSGLSGTGEHGVQKIFAPGQESYASSSGGSASDFAPGHEKP